MTDFADTADEAPAATRSVQHHPVRGAFWGLPLGIGLAIYLVIFRVIALSLPTMGLIVLAGIILGVVWGRFGPAKR